MENEEARQSKCIDPRAAKGFKAGISEIKSIPGGKVFRPLQKNKNAAETSSLCLYVSGYRTLIPSPSSPSPSSSSSFSIERVHDEQEEHQQLSDENKQNVSYEIWDVAIRKVFNPFGEVNSVEFIPNRTYCFVCYLSSENARSAYDNFNSNGTHVSNTSIRVRYAMEETGNQDFSVHGLPEPTNCDCDYMDTPATDPSNCVSISLSPLGHENSVPEQVELWLNFVSAEEERQILKEIDTTEESGSEEGQAAPLRPETVEESSANRSSEGLWLKSISRRVQVSINIALQ
jgi:hypothetical protein